MNQRIIYMGTPEFAVAGLKALVEGGFNVVAVVTGVDKPVGRGHQIQYTPVKQYALSQNLPVLQPERLKDEAFQAELRSYNADLQVIAAFRMLPEAVFSMPRLGTFNIHTSLLPNYRGAAPINWAVINGEKQTGLSTFMLDRDCDTGEIISQHPITIADDENVGSVHDRLMELSGEVCANTVRAILEADDRGEKIATTPQPAGEYKPAPKIFKETCQIDTTKTCREVYNFVRGLSPYPAAWCNLTIRGVQYDNVKVFEAKIGDGPITLDCADGKISLTVLQLPGKKRMDAQSLLNGLR